MSKVVHIRLRNSLFGYVNFADMINIKIPWRP